LHLAASRLYKATKAVQLNELLTDAAPNQV